MARGLHCQLDLVRSAQYYLIPLWDYICWRALGRSFPLACRNVWPSALAVLTTLTHSLEWSSLALFRIRTTTPVQDMPLCVQDALLGHCVQRFLWPSVLILLKLSLSLSLSLSILSVGAKQTFQTWGSHILYTSMGVWALGGVSVHYNLNRLKVWLRSPCQTSSKDECYMHSHIDSTHPCIALYTHIDIDSKNTCFNVLVHWKGGTAIAHMTCIEDANP